MSRRFCISRGGVDPAHSTRARPLLSGKKPPSPGVGGSDGKKMFVYLKSDSNFQPLQYSSKFIFALRTIFLMWVGRLGLARAPDVPPLPQGP